MVDVPGGRPVARPAAVMVATGVVGRRPGHLAGQVLGGVVGEGAGGRELLGFPRWRAGVGRCDGDRLEDAVVTVRTVEPVMPSKAARIVDRARARRRGQPGGADRGHEVVAEAQVTWLVRSSVELSDKVPVAVNCSVSPVARLGLAGVTAIDWRTAAVTVSTVEPVMPSRWR